MALESSLLSTLGSASTSAEYDQLLPSASSSAEDRASVGIPSPLPLFSSTNSTVIFNGWTREQIVSFVSLAYVVISILMVVVWSVYLCIDGRRTKRDTRVIHMLAQSTMFRHVPKTPRGEKNRQCFS